MVEEIKKFSQVCAANGGKIYEDDDVIGCILGKGDTDVKLHKRSEWITIERKNTLSSYDRIELYGIKNIFPQIGMFEGEFRDDEWYMLIRYGRIAIYKGSIEEVFRI